MQFVIDAVVRVIEILEYFDLDTLDASGPDKLYSKIGKSDKGDVTFGCVIVFSQMFCNRGELRFVRNGWYAKHNCTKHKRKYQKDRRSEFHSYFSFLSLVVRSISNEGMWNLPFSCESFSMSMGPTMFTNVSSR